jgi:acetate kinase
VLRMKGSRMDAIERVIEAAAQQQQATAQQLEKLTNQVAGLATVVEVEKTKREALEQRVSQAATAIITVVVSVTAGLILHWLLFGH